MIFLWFNNMVAQEKGYPAIASCLDLNGTKFSDRLFADYIFEFEGTKTVYLKNRMDAPPNGYQFTSEERLVMVLKAVPL